MHAEPGIRAFDLRGDRAIRCREGRRAVGLLHRHCGEPRRLRDGAPEISNRQILHVIAGRAVERRRQIHRPAVGVVRPRERRAVVPFAISVFA